jgi:hypothetical protein
MPAGANTKRNVGIRRLITSVATPQYRNFEPNGAQTYVVMSSKGHTHGGTTYTQGQTIPYDAAGSTLYTDYPRMEREFNRNGLDPSN